MFALTLVKLLAGATMSVFTLICFAQGLFYIADVVEEHGQTAKKTLKVTLFGVIALHVLLLFDRDTPTLQVLVGLVAHLIYLALLPQFPFVHIRSPIAICSALAAVVNHFSWFLHLLLSDSYIYTYSEVGGIFVVCVWLCPLAFIVSLSSTEPLPITSGAAPALAPAATADDDADADRPAHRPGSRKGRSLLAVFCRFLKSKSDQLLPLTHKPAFPSPDPLSSSTAAAAAATASPQPATAFPAVPMSPSPLSSSAAAASTTGVPVPAISLLGVGTSGVPAHSQMTPHQRKQFVPAYTADDHTQ